MFENRLFINNEFVESRQRRTFTLTNPSNDEAICDVYEALQEDVDLAVAAAKAAFPIWSALPAAARAKPLFKLVQLVERDADELAALDALCMGKPVELLKRMDLVACSGVMSYFAGAAYHILGETSMGAPNYINMSIRQPYGPVALILPWNVPMIMFAFKVAPAVICGNTVVLKPSEKAPLSCLKMAALVREAGFPPGVINVVPGFGATTGSALSLHMDIRKLSFTGSTDTGRKILKAAADSNLKNVSLELGGKGAAIIFEDADIESAARYTHFSIHHNSGQHCQANSRLLVQRAVAEKFINSFKALAQKVTVGDPFSGMTFQGPQADRQQLERIQKLVSAGAKDGNLIMGGERWGEKGCFMGFTILVDVPESSPAYQEEIFGPVVIINTFEDEADAIREANATEFGLFSSVFTKDMERAVRVSVALESGMVGVNCAVPLRAVDMPLGGWKQSGVGRELSLHGLNMFTELKTIYLKYGQDSSTLTSKWHNEIGMENGV